MVLVTPDLLAQGLGGALLERLAADGIGVVAAVPVRPSPQQVARLYEGPLSHPADAPPTHGRWLSPALFDGVCLALILAETSVAAGAAPLQTRVTAMKGRSRRGAAPPAALRSVSPWVDRHLSGMHSPDDTAGLVRESVLLLGRTAARRALAARRLLDPQVIAALAAPGERAGAAHPIALLVGLVARGAALALGLNLGWGREAAEALWQAASRARRAVPDEPGPARLDWQPLHACQPALVNLARRAATAAARAVPWADLLTLARLQAALLLLRSLGAMVAGGAAFSPEASSIQAQAWEAVHLPLGRWEGHRLHILAAYPEED